MSVVQVIAAAGATIAVVGIVWYVLAVIAQWKLFTTAGEAGWKSIIPILNGHVLYKICWKASMFWLVFILAVVAMICAAFAASSVFALILVYILYLVIFIISIVMNVNLAKAFGHGGGFAVGLIFLNIIFMLILGLGNSEYQGKN